MTPIPMSWLMSVAQLCDVSWVAPSVAARVRGCPHHGARVGKEIAIDAGLRPFIFDSSIKASVCTLWKDVDERSFSRVPIEGSAEGGKMGQRLIRMLL